jgi:hypothetical protein
MTVFKHRETGEVLDDGVPGDLADMQIARWHFNDMNFDIVGPSPEPADSAQAQEEEPEAVTVG